MNPKLYGKLVSCMEKWMIKMTEEDELPVGIFWGNDVAMFMAESSRSVFDAVVETQRTAIEQNNLREVGLGE